MNVTLRQLRAFAAVARHGGFTRAAPALFVSQSALTGTVRQLEGEIGLSLFERTTRQVTLTRAGRDFLPVAERLLQDFDSAMSDIRGVAEGRRGHVRVAAGLSVVTTFLMPAVARFSERYPNIKVHLRDDNGDGINRRVKRGEVDLGISGKFGDDPELEFLPLLEDRFGAVFRADHPLAKHRRGLAWRDLASHRYIESSPDTTVHATLAASVGQERFFGRALYEASSLTSLESLLEQGLGFTVFTALAASHNPSGTLCFKPLSQPTLVRRIGLITRRGRQLAPAALAMREQLLAAVRAMELPKGVRRLAK
jgi:DNA-binding transcriptional LysR family regulator